MESRQLFAPTSEPPTKRRVVATYDYTDEDGQLLFQAVRYSPKGFTQRRPDGKGGWIWNLQDTRRVLYRLPDLLNSRDVDPDAWVFVVEGEKDVDRLRELGLVATCNPQGAGKWCDEYGADLHGRRVAILPDNDKTGTDHAEAVANSVHQGAAEVRILELPGIPPKGDVSDFLNAGGTVDQLLELASTAPMWMAKAEFTPAGELIDVHPDLRKSVVRGIGRVGDVGNIIGPPKSLKSFLLGDLLLSVVAGVPWLGRFMVSKGPALLIDNELHPSDIAHRIPRIAAARGIARGRYDRELQVWSLRGRLVDINKIADRLMSMKPGRFKVVAVDALYRAMCEGFDENSNAQTTLIYNTLARVAEHLGAMLVVVHHTSKGVQGGKSVVDVGAGASAIARAADFHLVSREHVEPGCAVLQVANRSYAPEDPIGVRWDYPVWNIDPTLDVTQLKTDRKPGGRPRKTDELKAEFAAKETWTPQTFAAAFITDKPQTQDEVLCEAEGRGVSARRAKQLLGASVDGGHAHRWDFGRNVKQRFASRPAALTDLQQGDK